MGIVEIVLLVMVVMFLSRGFRRRWEGRGLPRGGPYDGGRGYGPEGAPRALPDPELQSYVETLETRIVSLEERLDFTEKLIRDKSEGRGER